ncbi:cora-like Mg2+ transporter protein-domain-containing protein [Russula vinacea]|nr:cora-like Mg2+ transporter protein-domain-containing protein [Russula vinacea]
MSREGSVQARKSVESRKTDRAPTVRHLSPKGRFRAAVLKVIAVHRTSSTILRGRLGAEPGVDPHRHSTFAAYRHVYQKCVIDVIDYSSIRCSSGRMTSSGFIQFLQNDQASARDYYPKHLFIRVLSHTLGSTNCPSPVLSSSTPFPNVPRSASPQRLDEKLSMADEGVYENFMEMIPIRWPMSSTLAGLSLPHFSYEAHRRRRAAAELTLDELKKDDRVNVHIKPMCIFLFRDGTVISFNPRPNLDLTEPIAARIRLQDSSLRTTADPSLLVQSLLDLTVDAALEVVDEYHARINALERAILIKSKVSIVRSLHILSGDLILHKRTLGPVKALIYALRHYDADRTAASLDDVPVADNQKVAGYMSHKAKIYLADVYDHIEYAMTSLDMYSAMAENLVNYSFNMASYETNEVMRRLTLCTILFLPLTLLTGYFGMNFENMWSIHHGHSDIVFWIIAIPIMSVVAPTFMWPDILRMYHQVKKRSLAQKITKARP